MVKEEGGEGEYSSEYTGKKFVIDLVCGVVILAAWAGGYYYFEPFKNADGINGNDKFKFEIKRANDVEQRLDDVKGIDEIRNVIKVLINMLKNPSEYTAKGTKLYRGTGLTNKEL